MGEYLLILYTLSPLTSPGTCLSSWSSGGGACFSDFQVLALGGAALPSAWCRAHLSREAPRGTIPVTSAALSPGFSSHSNYGALPLQGLEVICSALGRIVLAVLGLPGLCLSHGVDGSWAVSWSPVLQCLCCWIPPPGHTAASAASPPEPL